MGLLSSIFGGGSSGPNFGAATSYMNSLQGIANQWGTTAAQASSNYGADSAQNQAALDAYSQYLQQNPATNQYNAQLLSNTEGDIQGSNAKASANLDQSLAQRGISAKSSIGVGGQASLAQGEAATNATNLTNIGEQEQAQHNQNLGTLANLWSGATGQAFGEDATAQNAQTGIYQGLTSDAMQQAVQNYDASQANNNDLASLFSGVGNAVGKTLTSYMKVPGLGH